MANVRLLLAGYLAKNNPSYASKLEHALRLVVLPAHKGLHHTIGRYFDGRAIGGQGFGGGQAPAAGAAAVNLNNVPAPP